MIVKVMPNRWYVDGRLVGLDECLVTKIIFNLDHVIDK